MEEGPFDKKDWPTTLQIRFVLLQRTSPERKFLMKPLIRKIAYFLPRYQEISHFICQPCPYAVVGKVAIAPLLS